MKHIELGITTFVETVPNPHTNVTISQDVRIQQIIEEIVLAESVGLSFYGIGEHHRKEFAASAPEMILAAAASVTRTIKLGSSVTVLSSDDPVRVYQRFATLNALSYGRAEITAGRGSFIESFPLFGYDLDDYEALFEEKLDLLLNIRDHEITSHDGPYRAPYANMGIYPRTNYPLWISRGVGGSPESVIRAAERGMPLFLAIIGGNPYRFSALTDVYRKHYRPSQLHPEPYISVHFHGYLSHNEGDLASIFFPSLASLMNTIGKERGWAPYTKSTLKGSLAANGALYAGTPEVVAKKIILFSQAMGIDRFTLHVPVGYMEHHLVLKTIQLFGEKVKPIIDKAYTY
jgi:probable LLM family oxidoreductase